MARQSTSGGALISPRTGKFYRMAQLVVGGISEPAESQWIGTTPLPGIECPPQKLSGCFSEDVYMTITQTDKAVAVACGVAFLITSINAKLGSIWLLYLNVLLTAGVFGYAIREWGEFSYLSRSAILGIIASITYLPLDWLFSRRVGIRFYLSLNDIRIAAVPLSLLLTWMVAITAIIYLYHRLNAIWERAYLSAGITGVAAFIGSTIFDQLGSVRLWNWNATRLASFSYIGSVPIFIPTALALTFLLSPYYFGRSHVIVAGIRCGLFMGTMQFLCFALFHYIGISS